MIITIWNKVKDALVQPAPKHVEQTLEEYLADISKGDDGFRKAHIQGDWEAPPETKVVDEGKAKTVRRKNCER